MKNYFSESELECHCPRCAGQHTAERIDSNFLHRLNLLRDMWGQPIYVSDAYRCPEHNRDVGGVENSQHRFGVAADIYVDGGQAEYERFFMFVKNSRLFDGVGYYPNEQFVHVDLRSGGSEINTYLW